VREKNSVDTKVSEKAGGGGAPAVGAEVPLQLVVKTMVRQVVPLQSMEVHSGAGGCPKESVTSWGACAGAGSWQDLWTRGERSPCWSRFAGRTWDPRGVQVGVVCS